jgi:ketosteroid isomerase-like protein
MLANLNTHKINKGANTMSKILSCHVITIFIALFSITATAEHHNSLEAEVRAASMAFDKAYATNDVEAYFDFYTDDAVVYFFGARQKVSDYKEEWTAMLEAGAGVEKNEMSDVQVQVMPSGDVAVVTSFIDNQTRGVDGELTTARAFETDIFQKIDGKWRIVGLHYSEIAPEEE